MIKRNGQPVTSKRMNPSRGLRPRSISRITSTGELDTAIFDEYPDLSEIYGGIHFYCSNIANILNLPELQKDFKKEIIYNLDAVGDNGLTFPLTELTIQFDSWEDLNYYAAFYDLTLIW